MQKLIKMSVVLAALVVGLGFAATRASADQVTYNISAPNTALGSLTPPYATVTVTLTSSTTATVTFTSLISNGDLFLMGGNGAADVNVNASSWTIGNFVATNTAPSGSFTPGPLSDGGSANVSSFGVLNQQVDSFDGFQHSSTQITFVLTNTGGTWASASDVLTANSAGYLAAIHGFVCQASDCTSVIVTGYAGNGGNGTPVPEPASIALFGSGLMTLAGMIRKRRKQTKA